MSKRHSTAKRIIFFVGLVLSVSYVMPFVLVFLNAFKPKPEILSNPLAWPVEFTWDNFSQAMTKMNFFMSLTNSIIITVISVSALILVSSMLAYYLSRTKSKFSKTTFLILVASMIVPFQALMIPFMALFAPFVSLNNRAALIFFYVGFGVALSTFLYHGFISNIPLELDEAAAVGALVAVEHREADVLHVEAQAPGGGAQHDDGADDGESQADAVVAQFHGLALGKGPHAAEPQGGGRRRLAGRC